MNNAPLLDNVYTPPSFSIGDISKQPPPPPPVLNQDMPPPLPPKPSNGAPSLPAKPMDLARDIASAKLFPRITNYEDLSDSQAAIGREVPCHVPNDIYASISPTVLPIPISDFPVITKEDAVNAFRQYVNSKLCWEHSFTNDLLVLSDEMCYCYKITLDTFFEGRSASWQETSASSALLTPENGIPPPAWDIQFNPPNPFEDGSQTFSIPYTDVLKPCPNCFGKGQSLCTACRGQGIMACPYCQEDPSIPCTVCNDQHTITCTACNGKGEVPCTTCQGQGQVKRHIEVKSEYKTHTITDYIARGGLTKEYLALLEGKQVYSISGRYLVEGESFYDNEVNTTIRGLFTEVERIIHDYEVVCREQQLTVSIIPIRILNCQSGDNHFDVSVFDSDLKIFCPDYPVQKCGMWKNLSNSCCVMFCVCFH